MSATAPPLAQSHTFPQEPLNFNVADRQGNLEITGEPNGFTLEQSPGVLTLLSDKLDAQTRVSKIITKII